MKMIRIVLLALAGLLSPGIASAASLGALSFGDIGSDVFVATGPTFARDYSFHLNNNNVTLTAAGAGQHSGGFNINNITLELYKDIKDPAHLLGSTNGLHSTAFESVADFGHVLGIGDYILSVFGNITAGSKAFIAVAAAPNIAVNQTPLPAAGIMFLTGLVGLGLVKVRKHFSA